MAVNEGNLNPVDVSGALNIPENPNAPKQELPDAAEEQKLEGQEVKKEEENQEEDPVSAVDPAFQELRDTMIAAGVDFADMDAKFAAGEDIGDENIELIKKHSGYSEKAIRSYIKLKQDNLKFSKEEGVRAEAAKDAFLKDVDEKAGGSYADLQDWVMKNVPQSKVDIWNAALKTLDAGIQLAVVEEMQNYRASKVGKGKETKGNKPNLDLLTRSSNSKDSASPAQTQVNTLEGNPLANQPIQTLAQIKQLGPAHPEYENALAVLRVRAPYMV